MRLLRRLSRWLLRAAAAWFAFCTLLLCAYGIVLPPTTAVQLQRRLEAIVDGRSPALDIRRATGDAVAAVLPRAVVAAEDGRFFEHHGIDVDAMRQALRDNEQRQRARGGSTITQQLVKNLFLSTRGSYVRKALEVPLALLADLLLTKDRQLELYVNVAEWGPGLFGVEAAARHHLGKSASQLTRTDAAGLASLLPAPRTRTISNSAWYRAIILRRMDQMGY